VRQSPGIPGAEPSVNQDPRFAWMPNVEIVVLIMMLVFAASVRYVAFTCGGRA
jgi:hypothetical protein